MLQGLRCWSRHHDDIMLLGRSQPETKDHNILVALHKALLIKNSKYIQRMTHTIQLFLNSLKLNTTQASLAEGYRKYCNTNVATQWWNICLLTIEGPQPRTTRVITKRTLVGLSLNNNCLLYVGEEWESEIKRLPNALRMFNKCLTQSIALWL